MSLSETVGRRCRVAFCVSGAGRIARAAIENAAQLSIEPVLLVAEQRAAEDLEAFCATHGVALVRLPAARTELDRALIEACFAARPDLIVLTFDKLVPWELVDAWPGRILNLHMGLLPATAGLHPLRRAIESGASVAGATVHEVTNDVDSGPIVASVEIPIESGDTPESLGARVYPEAKRILLESIARYAFGVRRPQTSLVTTIIPVFNRASMLREAVGSVLAQTHRPIEIVIVDDGSTDDTAAVADVLAREHAEVRVIHQANGGPGRAREAGRLAARGDFIQYLDSDDLLLPRKFGLQVAGLNAHPECGASYGWTRIRYPDGSAGERPWKRTGEQITTMFPAFLESRWWDTSTPLFRRVVVDAAGPWSELRVEEDWEYDARIASRGTRMHYVDEWVSETRQLDPLRLSLVRGTDVMRDRATAHMLIYDYAMRAGVPRDAPEMRHFARELFLLARQCGAAGLAHESETLFLLAREASGTNSLQFRAYEATARILGWPLTGKLACLTDRLRW